MKGLEAFEGGVPLRYCTTLNMGQSPPSISVGGLAEGSLPFLQGNAEFGPIGPQAEKGCYSPAKTCQPGDVLLSVRAPVGALNIADRVYGIGRGLCAITPQAGVDRRYLWWALHEAMERLSVVASGSTYDSVSISDVGDLRIRVPAEEEQRRIADYLDEALADLKRVDHHNARLLDLLEERRWGLIRQAVTGGHSSEPPSDWSNSRLKYEVSSVIDTEHKTVPFHADGDFLVARTPNIRGGQLDLTEAKWTNRKGYEEWTRRGMPEPGDVMFTREAPAGEACVVPDEPPLCIGQRVVLLKIDQDLLDSRFLVCSLYAGRPQRFVEELSQGSTVSHLNMSDVVNIPLWVPPIEEQRAIVRRLEHRLEPLDVLEERVGSVRRLTKERRQSLITAAVTGELDVTAAGRAA